jgi:Uma2 family endonuclease
MGQVEPQARRYTPEEYFALEAQSEVRHDYVEGEVFTMAGGSKSHNILAQNDALSLRVALRGQGYPKFSWKACDWKPKKKAITLIQT